MDFAAFVKLFAALGLILIMIVGLVYLLKKFVYSSPGMKLKKFRIEVLGSETLGPKKFLSVVKIAGKYYILGVTDSSITKIDTITPTEDFEEPYEEPETGKGGFLEILKKNLVNR